jgi:hypothetical protein
MALPSAARLVRVEFLRLLQQLSERDRGDARLLDAHAALKAGLHRRR